MQLYADDIIIQAKTIEELSDIYQLTEKSQIISEANGCNKR